MFNSASKAKVDTAIGNKLLYTARDHFGQITMAHFVAVHSLHSILSLYGVIILENYAV